MSIITNTTLAFAYSFILSNLSGGAFDAFGIDSLLTLSTISLFSMALIFIFLMKFQFLGMFLENRPRLPPGPKPWPVIGSLPEMLMNSPKFRWIERLMAEINTEIMCIRLVNVHVVVVSSPEIACEFLKRQDANFSSRPFCLAAAIASKYLSAALTPLGDQWKKMRRVLATETLSQARHGWLQDKRNEESDHLIRYVFNLSMNTDAGSLVNLRTATQHYCGNVIRKLIFNKRFFGAGGVEGGPGAEEEEHVNALFTILKYLYSFCISDYLPFLREVVDLDGHEKVMRKVAASTTKYHDPIIEERIQQWMDGTKSVPEDLLDILINLKDGEGKPLLSVDEIKGQIVELMIATVDNPSNCIEWALAEMINQPEMLEKAVEEVDRVVGKERLVQEADIPNLNYIKACAREAFRLHPIAPFNIPHVSISDANVAGYFIPKGSHVLLSRPGLGRNARAWEAPLRFIPERHLKNDGSEVVLTDPDLRVFSFSTGRRGCAGVTLGSTITTMLLARLVQGFTWSKPPGVTTVDLAESVDEMSLATPLLAVAKPRLDHSLYPVERN